uniref:AraC family transcriptional regulator n=1 Tax=Ascaris lumbricoides TaxID=6252 RepID=A0A0M3HF75_ASCLU
MPSPRLSFDFSPTVYRRLRTSARRTVHCLKTPGENFDPTVFPIQLHGTVEVLLPIASTERDFGSGDGAHYLNLLSIA